MTASSLYGQSKDGEDVHRRVAQFIAEHVRPGQRVYEDQKAANRDPWAVPPVIEDLKPGPGRRGFGTSSCPTSVTAPACRTWTMRRSPS